MIQSDLLLLGSKSTISVQAVIGQGHCLDIGMRAIGFEYAVKLPMNEA